MCGAILVLRFKVRNWLCGALALPALSGAPLTASADGGGNGLVVAKTPAFLPASPERKILGGNGNAAGSVARPGASSQTAPEDATAGAGPASQFLAKRVDRSISIEVPLKYQAFYLGDVPVRIS